MATTLLFGEEERIEPACPVKCQQFVAAADMAAIDKICGTVVRPPERRIDA